MGYYDLGYIATGYFEGDTTTLTPSDKIVNITRSFVLNGVDITSYVTDAEIIRENHKAYSTLSMSMMGYEIDKTYIRNKDIRLVVTIGTMVYSFILFDVDRDYKGKYEIIAKTQGCLLDYPFSPKINDLYSGTGNEIIGVLCAEISHYNTLPDFKFNEGSFTLEGSKLEGVDSLVAVSGGTYYEVNDHLIFVEHLRVNPSVTPKFIFTDEILTSKAYSDNYSGSPLVNKVVFNANEEDILSEPLITMVTNEDCSRPYFMFNPTPDNIVNITSNLGTMYFSFKEILVQETFSANFLRVNGGIDSIKQITLNGVVVSDTTYQFIQGQNVILFDDVLNGIITVTYISKVIQMYQYNGKFDFETRSNIYNVQYLNQILDVSIDICADVLDMGGLNNNSIELVGEGMSLDTPTQFDVIGTINNISFVSNPSAVPAVVNGYYAYGDFNTTFMLTISKQIGLSVQKSFSATMENLTANYADAGVDVFGFYTSNDIEISEAMVGSVIVLLTKYDAGGYYIYYTTQSRFLNLSATCTYTAIVDRYTIPAVGASNTVRWIDFYNDNGVSTFEYPEDGTCLLPTHRTIDVASLLDTEAHKVSGKVVTYKGISYTIASNGTFLVYLTTAEKVIVDTGHIKKGTYITIDTTYAEFA
jgi:hypothetical protein